MDKLTVVKKDETTATVTTEISTNQDYSLRDLISNRTDFVYQRDSKIIANENILRIMNDKIAEYDFLIQECERLDIKQNIIPNREDLSGK